MERGKFYVFEGIDGSGKGTQIALLKAHLENNGRRVLVIADPGQTVLGTGLRRILKSKEYPRTPVAEALLFAAARRESLETLAIPALEQGTDVIYDRFLWSTRAYQGAGNQIPDAVAAIEDAIWDGLGDYVVDHVFYLKCPLEIALKRRLAETGYDAIEARGIAYFERVVAEFDRMFDFTIGHLDTTAKYCTVVHAELAPTEVHRQVVLGLKSEPPGY